MARKVQVVDVSLTADKSTMNKVVRRDAAASTRNDYKTDIDWPIPEGAVALRFYFLEPYQNLSREVVYSKTRGGVYTLPFAALDAIDENPPKGTTLYYDIEVIFPGQSHVVDPVVIIQP